MTSCPLNYIHMRECNVWKGVRFVKPTEALTEGRRANPDAATAVQISGGVSGARHVTPFASVRRVQSRSSVVHGPAGRLASVDNCRRRNRPPVLYTRVVRLIQPVYVSLLVSSARLLLLMLAAAR